MKKGKSHNFIFPIIVIALFIILVSCTKSDPVDISLSEMILSIKKGKVKEIVWSGWDFSGKLKSGEFFTSMNTIIDKNKEESVFTALRNANIKHGTKFGILPTEKFDIENLLEQVHFMLYHVVFIYSLYFGGRLTKFRKIQETKDVVEINFSDVGGAHEIKKKLEEIVYYLKNPEKTELLGVSLPKGILLIGEPGTGKTLIARALAAEASLNFMDTSGSDFIEVIVGVGARRIRNLFEQAKNNAPCILFIDEVDSVARDRHRPKGGHGEREQTLNQLLVEMDGFEENDRILIIGATNRPYILDSAVLRPGRFDQVLTMPLPSLSDRLDILKLYSKNVSLGYDAKESMEVFAKWTAGFSGADLENFVNDAALLATKSGSNSVRSHHFETIISNNFFGSELIKDINPNLLTHVAYHEAGHTLLFVLSENTNSETAPILHSTTIAKVGGASGLAVGWPLFIDFPQEWHSRDFYEWQIFVSMGGGIAEMLVLGNDFGGSLSDYSLAYSSAADMVCFFGMTEDLVLMPYFRNEEPEHIKISVDREIYSILVEHYCRAFDCIQNHSLLLHKIAKYLLMHETIFFNDIRGILYE